MLKHIRNWSFDTLEREVRATWSIGCLRESAPKRCPTPKRWLVLSAPWERKSLRRSHGRIVFIAQERKVVKGQRIRLDTTVTETNIHYPTDSSLLGDGVRVLTRTMKRIVKIAQGVGERVRNRMRSVSHRVMELRAPAVARYRNSR